ncbi:unnamed protein product [Urochloa humidicola]
MVDKWLAEEWEANHQAAWDRPFSRPDPTHHQGNRHLGAFKAKWSEAHGGLQIGPITAFDLSHKGKVTSDVTFNPEDGPEAYTNPLVHTRLSQYSEMARQVNEPEWDPTTAKIDGDILMRVGGGKQHG